jgi:transposase InsO family protein
VRPRVATADADVLCARWRCIFIQVGQPDRRIEASGPSCRDQRDEQIAALIEAEREQSRFARVLGSRQMWLRLRGQGHDVARCTIERIMRQRGWEGARRGRRAPRTTQADEHAARPADLVGRRFTAAARAGRARPVGHVRAAHSRAGGRAAPQAA